MKNRLCLLVILVLGLVLYGLTLRGNFGNPLVDKSLKNLAQATGPFESSHERAPYALTVSLVKNHVFSLSKELANYASPDSVSANNKFFIIFPPGISLLTVPFFLLGEPYHLSQLISYAGMGLFGILNLIVIFLISKNIFKFSSSLSFFVSLIFGFATTSWSYAASLYQHHATTFLMLSSFYAAWKYKHAGRLRFAWASWVWAALGFSVWLDYPSVFLIAPNVIYLLLNSINIQKISQKICVQFSMIFIFTFFVFLGIVGYHGYYNYKNFGSWKTIAQLLPRYDLNKIKNSKTIIPESEKNKNISGVVQEDRLFQGLYILSLTSNKGLFFFSPIFLLALLGIIRSIKKGVMENIILLAIVIVNLFFYGSWADPWGGWAFGPRYLIPSMAPLAIFVGYWLHNTKYKIIGKITALFLFVISSAISLLGALTTTLIPPKVEADYLHMKYNFLLNWDYLMAGKSGSFAFNEFFSRYVNLTQYYFVILGIVVLAAAVVLFVGPRWEK